MKYVYCPKGHMAHYIHGGAFEKKWFQAVCDVCDWHSERAKSEQELDRIVAKPEE